MKYSHQVAILAYDKLSMFELGCALELFALPRPEFESWYQAKVISLSDSKISAFGGIQLKVETVSSLKSFDTLIVPGWSSEQNDISEKYKKIISQFYQSGGRIISFCSGTFLLAELGLLDGREVTTHWRYAELFQQRFPKVKYVDNVLYTSTANIWCSAGSAAALDLGLEVIRQDYGAEVGNQVARRLVVAPHRQGGQAQFVDTRTVIKQHGFGSALDWAIQHLDKKIEISEFATQANMSRRSFDRHFRTTTNMSPKQWLNKQRLKTAQELLEQELLSVEKIAQLSGFENAMNLRHYFRKYLGTTPSLYKQQFSTTLGVP